MNRSRPPEELKVLIVDDSSTNRKLLRAQLEAQGIQVLEAGDGVEALGVLREHPSAAVISDILMPKMDGFRLLSEIRKDAAFGAVPIIVYTATYPTPSDRERCLQLGADLFITKPASGRAIAAALAKLTAESGSRGPRYATSSEQLAAEMELAQFSETALEVETGGLNRSLLSTFKAEAAERIPALSARLIELEKAVGLATPVDTVESAFREVHSLKGAAGAVKATAIEALCQPMESVFSAMKRKQIDLSPSLLVQLDHAVGTLRSLLASLEKDPTGAGHPEAAEIGRRLEAVVQGKGS